MCKGGSLQETLQFNQIKLPQTPRLELLQVYTSYNTRDIQRYTIDTRYTRDKRIHTLGPSMPQVALTPLGLPSLASNHSSTQGSKQVMPPQVGYSITC
jgi:hypothetical protein